MRGEKRDFEAVEASAGAQASGDEQGARARSVLAAFVTLPLVFLIVVMVSLAVLGKPGANGRAVAPVASAPVEDVLDQPPLWEGTVGAKAASYVTNPHSLGLAPDATISTMALDGEQLAVESRGEIILYDLRSGVVLQRIKLHGSAEASGAMVNGSTPTALRWCL